MSRFDRLCKTLCRNIPGFSTQGAFFGLVLFALVGLPGCVEEGVQWTPRERQNMQHIFSSLEAASAAAQLASQLPQHATAAQRTQVARQLEIALNQALRVNDTVLEKIHPQLWGKFRGDYQHALQQLLRYYRTGVQPGNSQPTEQLREFTRWYSAHEPEFRW